MTNKHFALKFLREEVLPTAFCPGCGNGIVINCFLKALEETGSRDLSNFAFVSGIGCAAWCVSPYFRSDSLHTTHGRPIAFASGLKLARPELNVVVISGDGDLVGIGGNHLIHAARRNIDLFVICINNLNYGMTGGQVGPTTLHGVTTTTTPYGNPEYPFDLVRLVESAGANFVARWTTVHVRQLIRSIKKALKKEGFRFIEVVSQCPTAFGRRIGKPTGIDLMKWFQKQSIHINQAQNVKETEDKIIVGEFADRDRPGFISNIYKIIRLVRENNDKN
jgi:2-oxoglutarate ferredoxin oxidoreductase subunit beta